MAKDDLSEAIRQLPLDPGIYRFFDKEDRLIYVGKAKELRKRVSSYFGSHGTHNRKTIRLVEEIRRIEYTVTPTEFDALLLENSFIKEYQPRYNFLLKDDKTYPYLCVLNERFPRIIATRKYEPGRGEYFGPYANAAAMKSVLDLLRRLYTIRTCSLTLSEENIQAGKFKVCLEYHIGNCKGPCIGQVPEQDYQADLRQVRQILRGRLREIHDHFHQEMLSASDRLEFEKAEHFRRRIDLLSRFQSRNTVVNRDLSDLDVITIQSDERRAWINFMQVREGAVIFSTNREIEKKLDEADTDIIATVYHDIRRSCPDQNHLILTNVDFDHHPQTDLVIPQIGDKKKLIELSLENAHTQREKRENQEPMRRQDRQLLEQAQKDLSLRELPVAIECFDNSNLQGTSPVAAMVRFQNGKPAKSEYRHYNIKTVTGPDDFASMKEIITRRYTRLVAEEQPLPQLIIVDGGKGQLSAACEALQSMDLYGKIPIIGIAKNLEEIFFPGDSLPLLLSKRSTTLRLIQQMRDEAHRFGITFHRKKRSKGQLRSQADEIAGIGKATMEKLLRHYRSLKKIREAPLEELAGLVGMSKAQALKKGTADTPREPL